MNEEVFLLNYEQILIFQTFEFIYSANLEHNVLLSLY